MSGFALVDLVKVQINSTGTGPLSLGATVVGFFGVEQLIDGTTYSYSIQQGAGAEIGRGVYTLSGQTMSRGVVQSTNAGNPINLSPGAIVSMTVLAEDLQNVIDTGSGAVYAAQAAASAQQAATAGASAGADAGAIAGTTAGAAAGTGAGANASRLTPGAVTKLAPGSAPTVSITGAAGSQVLALGLVTGDTGDVTPAATTAASTATTQANLSRAWASQPTGDVDPTTYPGLKSALASAILAGHRANDNTDTDVPGGSAGERGAKWWAALAQAAYAAVQNAMSQATKSGLRKQSSAVSGMLIIAAAKTAAGKMVFAGIDTTTGYLRAFFDGGDASFSGAVRKTMVSAVSGLRRINSGTLLHGFSARDAAGKRVALFSYDMVKLKPVGPMAPLPARTYPQAVAAADLPVLTDIIGFPFYGQSNSDGGDLSDVVTTAQPFSNLMLSSGTQSDGSIDSNFVPLVEAVSGSRGETLCSGACNYAVEQALRQNGRPTAQSVLWSAAMGEGNKSIAQLSYGTTYFTRMVTIVTKAKALATTAGKSFSIPAIGFMQGENDIASDYATYYAALRQLRIDIDYYLRTGPGAPLAGQTSPIALILGQTLQGARRGAGGAAGGIQRAQIDLCLREPHFYMAGPWWDMPWAATSSVHFSGVSYARKAAMFGRAFKQFVFDGITPQYVKPLAAIYRNGKVRVTLELPWRPSVMDLGNFPAVTDYGFAAADDGGTIALGTPTIEDGDTIVWTPSRAPGANAYIAFALDNGPSPPQYVNGAGGNLRDSCADTVTVAGVNYPLWNLCPHFQLNIISL